MSFRKYQHIEKLGKKSVEGIEHGKCYVFPKIDGANTSIWIDNGLIKAGSRNRELSFDNDNAGFLKWALAQNNIMDYLSKNPTHILYGEWLVPHTLKTYRETAWRKFYVFDVFCKEGKSYLSYNEYSNELEIYSINFIIPICVIEEGTESQFVNQLEKNVFLIEDGKGVGEGIVIKNYDWTNEWGNQIWAKIVRSEFKEAHSKEQGIATIKGRKSVENSIVDMYLTTALCEKTHAKIVYNKGKWSKQMIPLLLNSIYDDLVVEEILTILDDFGNPTIDFARLRRVVNFEVRKKIPNIFT